MQIAWRAPAKLPFRLRIIWHVLMCVCATSGSSYGGICHDAAVKAATDTGVPVEILARIGQTANDNSSDIWPWTVHEANGQRVAFATTEAAQAFVFAQFMRGAHGFSIGCFQIRHTRKLDDITNLEQLFDPHVNASVVARRLLSLRSEDASWSTVLKAYRTQYLGGDTHRDSVTAAHVRPPVPDTSSGGAS